MLWWREIFCWRSGRATQGEGCAVPKSGTGRYIFKGKFEGARLKLAATKATKTNGCPVPKDGTGRYKFNGNLKGGVFLAMPNIDNSSLRYSRRRRRLKISLLAILAVLLVIGVVVFRNAGHWLVREDPVGKADVIVVLSGGLPFRAEGAASVFKSGYAPAVWVSKPAGPQEELAALGIHFVGEEEYNREILVQQGVPDTAIRDFSGRHRQYAGRSGGDFAGNAAGRESNGDYCYFAAAHAPREGAVDEACG